MNLRSQLAILLVVLAARAANAAPLDPREEALRALAREQETKRTVTLPESALLEAPVDPATYRVGPGDRFHVQVLGQASFDFLTQVDPEGWVALKEFGSVRVAGLLLEEARGQIRDRVGRGLREGEIEIRLAEMRRFKVFVLGNVVSPGAYPVTAATRASEAIAAAGGLTAGASPRTIEIRREGSADPIPVDLAPFFHVGDTRGNPLLTDGDRILVPTRARYFSVHGAVAVPGIWDLPQGESLASLLQWNRPLPGADLSEARVARYREAGPLETGERFDTLVVALGPVLEGSNPFPLADGDRIFVRSLPRFHERHAVRIEGEVKYPGDYPIMLGEDHVSHVIARAGGVLPGALITRIALLRTPHTGLSTVLEEPVSSPEEKPEVLASSEAERMTIDLDGSDDVLLADGDRIIVPRNDAPVHLIGAIKNPGFYPHAEGWDAADYVRSAGGATRLADRSSARLLRGPHGTSTDARDASVEPGDIVFIPEREPLTTWARLKDVLVVAAQVATVVLVVDSIHDP